MRPAYTILLWIFCFFMAFFVRHEALAQSRDTVLIAMPRALNDISLLQEEPDPDTLLPVGRRTPSDLAPTPIRWRGFEISTLLASAQIVDTNIFAASQNTEADTITSLNPSIVIQKPIGRHSFNAALAADYKKYWTNTDEDVFNFNGTLGGLLEARHDIKLPLELTYTSGHEKRGQNFSANFSKEPIAFKTYGTALGITYEPNRLSLSLIGRHGVLAFDNGINRSGAAVIRNDGDRSSTQLELGASYKILPNHEPFISASIGKTDYVRGSFRAGSYSGPQQDSTNRNFLAGWKLSYKGLIEGSLALGYGTQDYDSTAIQDISSTSAASNINWNVTKRATLNLALSRSIKDDNENLQGVILTEGRIGLDFEFLHNLFYNAYAEYALADFDNINREDDIFGFGTGVRYVLSPRYSVTGDYDYLKRKSTAAGLDYDRHQFMVRLNTRF